MTTRDKHINCSLTAFIDRLVTFPDNPKYRFRSAKFIAGLVNTQMPIALISCHNT
jgi:hypothetical protein